MIEKTVFNNYRNRIVRLVFKQDRLSIYYHQLPDNEYKKKYLNENRGNKDLIIFYVLLFGLLFIANKFFTSYLYLIYFYLPISAFLYYKRYVVWENKYNKYLKANVSNFDVLYSKEIQLKQEGDIKVGLFRYDPKELDLDFNDYHKEYESINLRDQENSKIKSHGQLKSIYQEKLCLLTTKGLEVIGGDYSQEINWISSAILPYIYYYNPSLYDRYPENIEIPSISDRIIYQFDNGYLYFPEVSILVLDAMKEIENESLDE